MKTLSLLASLSLIASFSLHARVRVTGGPAFALSGGTVNQDALVGLYATWNGVNEVVNQSLKMKIMNKVKANPAIRNKILSPLKLAEHNLQFGYKGESGTYGTWGFIDAKYGFCHGMTIVTRQFAYMASFEPERKLKPEYSYEKNPEGWLSYYKNKVDDVMAGKFTTIVGFKNMGEFSKSPIQDYLKRHVAEQWAMNTARLSMFQNVFHTNFEPLTPETFEAFKKGVKNYLSKNFYPRVILGPGFYELEDPHVVMATKMTETSNKNCVDIEIFNVGPVSGGHYKTLRYCVGDYAWIADDDYLFQYDFALNTK